MKLRTVFLIDTVLAALFGVGFIVAPTSGLGLYGMDANPSALNMARSVGAMALGFAIVTWSARNAGPSTVRTGLVAGLVVTFALLAANDLLDTLNGTLNSLGWGTVALFAVLAVLNAVVGFSGDVLDSSDILATSD